MNLVGSGFGLLPHEDLIKLGTSDLRTLSKILGDQEFKLGTKQPTTYDTDVYSWLVMLFYDEAQCQKENAWVKDVMKECPNMASYVDRMRRILFPEITIKDV